MEIVRITRPIEYFKENYGFNFVGHCWWNEDIYFNRRKEMFVCFTLPSLPALVKCILRNEHNDWVVQSLPSQIRFTNHWADWAEKNGGKRENILKPKRSTNISLMFDSEDNSIVLEPVPINPRKESTYLFTVNLTELYLLERMIADGAIEIVEK